MKLTVTFLTAIFLSCPALIRAADAPLTFNDPKPQRYDITARASVIDPRAKAHPEIDFVFEKGGKPADTENASVDTRVNSYGIHAIRVHYANGWFGKFGNTSPGDDGQLLGKIRIEAATGEDFSPLVEIPKPDGMMERALQFVKWLAKENPQARWEYFLAPDGKSLRWDRVIISGSSHGSTTAARFAKHVKVDRVVMFCGPRDQLESWQGLPSATPANRYFGFSHVLDGGWSGGHYCRSWEMLGLHQFGPIVPVDTSKPPYGNTRRLTTDADVKGDDKRAHSSVTPGGAAVKDAAGKFIHEDVWRYLFNQPVERIGQPVPHDPGCAMDLSGKEKKAKK